MTLKVIDHGWDNIMKFAADMASHAPHIAVGVVGSSAGAAHGEGVTNSGLAAVHEYGLGVPQRSFIGATIDAKAVEYARSLADAYRKVMLSGGSVASLKNHVALKRVGLKVVGDIQRRISDGIAPANSPVTIARKGSSTPLVDTGQLRQSITFEVRS